MRKTREWCSSSSRIMYYVLGEVVIINNDNNNNSNNNYNTNTNTSNTNTDNTDTNNNDITTQQRAKNEPSSGMEGLLCIGRPNPMRLSSSMCL